ncbi:MAG: rod shape-determining protein MreC [Gammaproteobacteria bacterium]
MLFTRKPLMGFRCVLLVIVSVVLMFYDYRNDYFLQARSLLSNVVTPMQYVVNWPMEMIDWAKSSFSSHRALVEKNAHLQAQQLFLRGQLQRLVSLEEENSQLRQLLGTTSQVSEEVRAARLLAVSLEPFTAEVILDAGVNDAVFEGQAVLDGYGVLGQVIHVGKLTSRVMLVTDPRSAVPVQDERNGVRGIVQGMGAHNNLALINIPDTVDVQAGDVLTSSGLGLRYPMGYPVGKIASVSHVPGEHFAVIEVTPSAHLFRTRQVLLVWPNNHQLIKAKQREINT